MVLGRLPEPVSIAVGRAFKGWIVESADERRALLAALDRPIPQPEPGRLNFKAGPDATCGAPSRGSPFLAWYAPEMTGWPHIILSAWPEDPARRPRIQRDRYIWQTFAEEDAAGAELDRLRPLLPGAPVFPARR